MTTGSDVIAKVRELAAQNPDFKYPQIWNEGCVYVATQNLPACIFGRALAELGYTFEDKHEGRGLDYVLTSFEIPHTAGQLSWMNRVQNAQDTGRFSWSECIAAADTLYGARL